VPPVFLLDNKNVFENMHLAAFDRECCQHGKRFRQNNEAGAS
jgi:hypothetical protein